MIEMAAESIRGMNKDVILGINNCCMAGRAVEAETGNCLKEKTHEKGPKLMALLEFGPKPTNVVWLLQDCD